MIIEDLRENFVTEFIFPAIQADTIYEDRYLLGTCKYIFLPILELLRCRHSNSFFKVRSLNGHEEIVEAGGRRWEGRQKNVCIALRKRWRKCQTKKANE